MQILRKEFTELGLSKYSNTDSRRKLYPDMDKNNKEHKEVSGHILDVPS